MYKYFFTLLVFFIVVKLTAQNRIDSIVSKQSTAQRPKLIVGIVVDQMRWDYLYRYNKLYAADGGFKRLLHDGFSCQNTFINYTPTVTASGHASIYTGAVPAINGITGNEWWDYDLNKFVYSTEDDGAKTIGSNNTLGQMSPKNMLTTTIGDELRLATNFKSKVIGIALKDRSAILPAGHSGNAAYWYDSKTGDWITSSYYLNELPQWVINFNAKKLPDTYYAQDWNLLYPINDYIESTLPANGFAHPLKQLAGKNYSIIAATPFGNSLSFEMAKAAINGEQLGGGQSTDMLAVSLSTPDYIGHAYGPNSIEAEDGFLRLDKDLGTFLNFLDTTVGKGDYLVFLSSDHGVANVPAFLKANKIPAGNFDNEKVGEEINLLLKEKTTADNLVIGILNYQVYLNRAVINAAKINKDSVDKWVINYLMQQAGIERAFALEALSNTTLNAPLKKLLANGYYPKRSGDIQIIFQPQWIEGFLKGGTTHGVWNPYDAHIPLLWYGFKISAGATYREVYITDIAATIASMLHIQMPSGCNGHAIGELLK